MRLESITIKNFRCFKQLQVSLHPELTVLVAANGGGKTTVLDAARIAVWPYVKAFDLGSQTGKSATIQIDDVRLEHLENRNMEPQLQSEIVTTGDVLGVNEWRQFRESVKPRTTTKHDNSAKKITDTAKRIERDLQNKQNSFEKDLPVVVYLGTGRLWYQGRYTAKVDDKALDNAVFSRFWGYRDCLTATSSYKQFEDWYGWIYKSFREIQIERLEQENKELREEDYQYFLDTIQVIQNAINQITKEVTGWSNLQYSSSQYQKLVMSHPKHGSLPLDMLSDGIRNIVVLVADIAFRCIKLNPHMKASAARNSQGVVMIDEVDMFLHPQWQQQILGALRKAFPKIQFIVTTHSPQVLSTVPKECIRVLDEEGVIIPEFSPLAHESGDALSKIMGTHKQPQLEIVDKITEFELLVRNGKEDSEMATTIRNELELLGYQFDESDLYKWRFLAKNSKKVIG